MTPPHRTAFFNGRFRLAAGLGAFVAALLVAGVVLYHAPAAAAPAPSVVTITPSLPGFAPRVTLALPRQEIVVRNDTAHVLALATTAHAPAVVRLRVPPRAVARLTLSVPGLYHLYDATTAYASPGQAGIDVVRARPGAARPDAPAQGWIVVPGPRGVPLDAHMDVPAGADLLSPPVVAVQVGGTVTLHNYDTDAHNIVTDPADPTEDAFELFGTDDEPSTRGAERRITFTVPGLYHLYCSMHTHVAGMAGGWQVVAPDAMASGYARHQPMEAWVLVTPERPS